MHTHTNFQICTEVILWQAITVGLKLLTAFFALAVSFAFSKWPNYLMKLQIASEVFFTQLKKKYDNFEREITNLGEINFLLLFIPVST